MNTLIPEEQAAKLPNKTIMFPHDSQRRYLMNLDVFHQLHCLNMIRKALHPEYYKPMNPGEHTGDEDELLGFSHIDHCVDSIRQSLMVSTFMISQISYLSAPLPGLIVSKCTADISVLNWEWSDNRRKNQPIGNGYHTCRRFDKIQDWARQRATYLEMDFEYRTLNDPLNPAGSA
jgi:hypothetical protein